MEGLWMEEGNQTSYFRKADSLGNVDDLILSQRAWKKPSP